jgi:serine protease
MTKRLLLAATLAFAGAAAAEQNTELNNPLPHHFPTKERFEKEHAAKAAGSKSGQNLSYHGGPVIHSARVVTIFWGPSWGSGGSDASIATHIQSFFGQYGTSAEYNTITQYYDGSGNIHTSSLGNTSYFDSSTPPTNVTDAIVQQEVLKAIVVVGYDPSTIYEVFLPASSYSSQGTETSCGGPNLQYCAYHGHFSSSSGDVKYSSMPYPTCGGCQTSGWTTAQNFDHFSCHETREAVTDEDLNAWFDRRGFEADDKCAWTGLFIDNGFGYQPEWSNAAGGCVAKTP